MAHGIFISYRREDSIAYAGRLYDFLAAKFGEDHVFMDIDKIQPGADFVEVLNKSVRASGVLLAVIGKGWLRSKDSKRRRRLELDDDFVRLEIANALDNNVLVIPVLVGGASMPGAKDLPSALAGLSRRQAVALRDISFRDDADDLVASIEDALAASRRADPSFAKRRFRLVAQVLLIGAVIGGVGWYAWQRSLTAQPVELLFVEISPGEFHMGCVGGEECPPMELPRHIVAVDRFYIGLTEVTVDAYRAFARENKSGMPAAPPFNPGWKNANHPIVGVTWEQARDFCEWIGGRLPTEAEWEYAARDGWEGKLYPWGNEIDPDDANYYIEGAEQHQTESVGSFRGSKYGVYDMGGNVREWVADSWRHNYREGSEVIPDRKVIRDGSYADERERLRASYREHRLQTFHDSFTGFRCAGDTQLPTS